MEAVFVIRDITDRKQAEGAQLKRPNLAAIEAAVDGIGILQDETFQYVNRAHPGNIGLTPRPKKLVGQSWKLLYGPEETGPALNKRLCPGWHGDRGLGRRRRKPVATRKRWHPTFDPGGISLTLDRGEGLLIWASVKTLAIAKPPETGLTHLPKLFPFNKRC